MTPAVDPKAAAAALARVWAAGENISQAEAAAVGTLARCLRACAPPELITWAEAVAPFTHEARRRFLILAHRAQAVLAAGGDPRLPDPDDLFIA